MIKPTDAQKRVLLTAISIMKESNRVFADLNGTGARKDVSARLHAAGWIDSDGRVTPAGFLAVGCSPRVGLDMTDRIGNYNRQRFGKDTLRAMDTEYLTPRQIRRITKKDSRTLARAAKV